MNTFLKVLLFVILGLVCLKLLPFLFIPVALAFAGLLAVGALLMGGVATVAATGLTVVAGILAVALVLVAALSPIWIPVLAIVGLVSLCRRGGKATAV